jgi:hypothetical protein
MPRLPPITGTSDVVAEHHAAVDAVLTAAVHYFALVAGVANAFELAPPADGDRLPA